MSIIRKLFGNNTSTDSKDASDPDIEVSFGNEPDLADEDYKYVHTFLFFGLNEESFNTIAKEVQNHDEAHMLSLKKTQEDVLMVDFTNVPGGTNLDDVNWGSMFDEWIEKLPAEGVGKSVKEVLLKNREELVNELLPDDGLFFEGVGSFAGLDDLW